VIDLEEIKAKWLNVCGACDAGIGECTHPSGDYRPVMLELVEEIERLRRSAIYRAGFNGVICRRCGGGENDHRMHCRYYVGPLEHRFIHDHWNDTFGGRDFDCICGRSVRVGGMAGSVPYGDEPVCPDAAVAERGGVERLHICHGCTGEIAVADQRSLETSVGTEYWHNDCLPVRGEPT
jgi:hypothetical protein